MTEVHVKLGSLLKGERERRNLALADIAGDLKIAERHLQAIEDGDLNALPGPLYFGLFARSYAEALGIDYAKSLEAIKEDMGEPIDSGIDEPPAPVEATPDKSKRSERAKAPAKPAGPKRSSLVAYILIPLLILVLLAVVWIVLKKDGKFPLKGLTTDDNSAVADSDRNDATGSDWSQDYGEVASKGEKAALSLQMVAKDRTWAVVLADGDTALQTNLKPWREYNIGAQDKLIVTLGSPLSVELTLNGLPIDLSDPDKGTVSNVAITPDNMSMYVRRTPPIDSGTVDSIAGDSLSPADITRRAAPVRRDTQRPSRHDRNPKRPDHKTGREKWDLETGSPGCSWVSSGAGWNRTLFKYLRTCFAPNIFSSVFRAGFAN